MEGTKLGIEVNGVSFLVVGDKYLVGWGTGIR